MFKYIVTPTIGNSESNIPSDSVDFVSLIHLRLTLDSPAKWLPDYLTCAQYRN